MELGTLKAFEEEVRKAVPKFKLGYKNESTFQKVLGFFAYPFNPQYMTRYTTTFYPTVYFPSKDAYESQPKSSFTVLAHEMVHMLDTIEHPIWFRLSYALPQFAAILPLIVFGILVGKAAWILALLVGSYVLGCAIARKSIGLFWCMTIGGVVASSVFAVLLTGWYSAIFFAGLALFAPWPSPWRTRWELRGYAMTLGIMQWSFGSVPEILRLSVLKHFTSADYYFMSWDGASTREKLDDVVAHAQSGALQTAYPYSMVYAFMSANGELKKQ